MNISEDIAKDRDGQDTQNNKRNPEVSIGENLRQQEADSSQAKDKSATADVTQDELPVLLKFAEFCTF